MAWDPGRQKVVLYGGRISGASGPSTTYQDMWEWDGNNWTLISQTNTPGTLSKHQMVFQENANHYYLVIHGGDSSGGNNKNYKTYKYVSGNWVEESNPTGNGDEQVYGTPSDAFVGQSSLWHGSASPMAVLSFGGYNKDDLIVKQFRLLSPTDTTKIWHDKTPVQGDYLRTAFGDGVYVGDQSYKSDVEASKGFMIFYGGYTKNDGNVSVDQLATQADISNVVTALYYNTSGGTNNPNQHIRSAGIDSLGRVHHRMAYYNPASNSNLRQVIGYGGIQATSRTATNTTLDFKWDLGPYIYPQLILSLNNNPPARYEHDMVYDPVREQVVMFGGFNNDGTPRNDTWIYGLANTVTCSITSSASSGGTISPLGTTPCALNSNQSYVIDPDAGFSIDSVLVDGTPISLQNDLTDNGDGTWTYTFSNIQTSHNIHANFANLTGNLTVDVTPQEAINAGAMWRIQGESTWRNPGTTVAGLPVGTVAIEFLPLNGWSVQNQTAIIVAGSTTSVTAVYTFVGGYLRFAPGSYSVDESAGTVTLTVERYDGSTSAASVQLQVVPGTAAAGSDYISPVSPVILTWAAGESGIKTATIQIVNDIEVENTEAFSVNLVGNALARLGTPTVSTVTITDNDVLISGYVKDGLGTGIAGITINGIPGTVATDANGFYEHKQDSVFTGTTNPAMAAATFNPPSRSYNSLGSFTNQDFVVLQNLTISGSGSGSGNVTSGPAGISLAYAGTTASASADFGRNIEVTLTANPVAGSEFVKWSGDSGEVTSPSISLTMDSNKAVTAHFQQLHNVNVEFDLGAAGTFTSSQSLSLGHGEQAEFNFALNSQWQVYEASFSGTSDSPTFDQTSAAVPNVGSDGILTLKVYGPPAYVSVSPANGSGTGAIFTAVYSHPNSAEDIAFSEIAIADSLSFSGQVWARYIKSTNMLQLRNDAGTWQNAGAPGNVNKIGNSQCYLDTGRSSVSMNTTNKTMTVSFAIDFKPGFFGTKNIYLRVEDARSKYHGFDNPGGTYTIIQRGNLTIDMQLSPSTDLSGVSQSQINSMLNELATSATFKILNSHGQAVGYFKNGQLLSGGVETGEYGPGYQLDPGTYRIDLVDFYPQGWHWASGEGSYPNIVISSGQTKNQVLYWLPLGSVQVFLVDYSYGSNWDDPGYRSSHNSANPDINLWHKEGVRWRQERPGLPVSEWFVTGYQDVSEPIGSFTIKVNDPWGDQFTETAIIEHKSTTPKIIRPKLGSSVRVILKPDQVIQPNFYAKWRIKGSSSNIVSGQIQPVGPGYQFIQYKLEVNYGFRLPGETMVEVRSNQTTTHTQNFQPMVANSVKVFIRPVGARNAGARWFLRLPPQGGELGHGATVYSVSGPKREIAFKTVPGWNKPSSFQFDIRDNINYVFDSSGTTYQQKSISKTTNSQTDAGVEKQETGYIKIFPAANVAFDRNGDGKTDVAVYRPSDASWHFADGSAITGFGSEDSWPLLGDFDGDGHSDISYFNPEKNDLKIRGKSSLVLGEGWMEPVPGDYDGDGRTDLAIYHPESGQVKVYCFLEGKTVNQFKLSPGGFPFSGDWDGDGIDSLALYFYESGRWVVDGKVVLTTSNLDDVPVAADFDGDSDTDVAFFRPQEGKWIIEGRGELFFGQEGDVPVPGDYNGDGKAEIVVYRPSEGQWIWRDGKVVTLGQPGDMPLVRGK